MFTYGEKAQPVKSEDEILDQRVRKAIIQEIMGYENQERKRKSLTRYECYKDNTKKHIIQALRKQFDRKTVDEMTYATANVSIVRKIINKLAMVYNYGARRKLDNDAATEQLTKAEKVLEFNSKMKKANRFLKLQKNIMIFPKPVPMEDGKYTIKLEILQPHQYDIIEDFYDKERPMVMIMSQFKDVGSERYTEGDPAKSGRGYTHDVPIISSDKKDQKIADPDDSNIPAGEFIWWSKNYHFTTDESGEVIPNINGEKATDNPIGMFPSVNFALDQDGTFWADGGDDLIDAGILVNCVISHLNHVGVSQGYGQFYMAGQKVPTSVALGPSKMIRLEYQEGEPKPEIGFASANPQLAELRENVVMYVALTLTTNNLSTSGVSTKLDGNTTLPSGIAMMLDKAESMEDIDDQRQIFIDKEPEVWKRFLAWKRVYEAKALLEDRLREIVLPEDIKPEIEFGTPKPIISEKEHLDIIEQRQRIGINTELELILKDCPDLTEEQAKKKLEEIRKEKEERLKATMATMVKPGEEPPGGVQVPGQDDEEEDDGQEDPGPGEV